MDRCAETISEKKFRSLPVRRQHALLAELAESARDTGNYRGFCARYDVMHAWCCLDRYIPPPWLSRAEALQEYVSFHAEFARLHSKNEPAAPGPERLSWKPRFNVTIVVDQVRSPYNVGSILRLIDNAGFAGLIHATAGFDLAHARLRRAARGAERWIPVRHVDDLPGMLNRADLPVVGLENCSGAIMVQEWQPPEAFLLIVGNESYGIAAAVRACCSRFVHIPVFGFKRSMNVHQALAIAAGRVMSVLGEGGTHASPVPNPGSIQARSC